MKTQILTKGIGLLTVALVSLVQAGSAVAGPVIPLHSHPQTRLRPIYHPPLPHPAPYVPRLGIMGHVQYGYGMVVDSVNYGSLANRMGLERGDVIVRINNHPINNDYNYNQALLKAEQFHGGFVDLLVIDVRTGMTRHRAGNLDGGLHGPSLPRYAPPVHRPVGHSY